MEHFVIFLHVIGLFVAAVPQHLVAAWKPALQPLRAGPLDRRCNVVWGVKFTPVEDSEAFCSFTVTQMVYNIAILQGTYSSVCRCHAYSSYM